MKNDKKIENVENAVVYNNPADVPLGYFGWPTVALMNDGTLCVGVSGFRERHVCPFGKSVMFYSRDNGKTWTYPEIVNDGLIDDRDVGLTALPNGELLLTWFTSDTRRYYSRTDWYANMYAWKNDEVRPNHHSCIRRRKADGTWDIPPPLNWQTGLCLRYTIRHCRTREIQGCCLPRGVCLNSDPNNVLFSETDCCVEQDRFLFLQRTE